MSAQHMLNSPMDLLKKNLPGLALLVLFLGSCSDMGEPEILLPQVSLLPADIDFATITIGSTQTRHILVINSGEGELNGELNLEQSETAFALQPVGTFMVLPGDTLVAELSFTPAAEQTYSAKIQLSSDDLENPLLELALSGVGTPLPVPVLSVSSVTLNFGTLLSGDSDQRQITLNSTGNDTLEITSLTADHTVFSVDLTAPLELIPGASRELSVTFTPDAAGTFNGSLTITSNSSSSPDVISLTGVAETPVSYAGDVQPVWNTNCTGCHGSSAGLNLSSYSNLMAGNSSNGPVVAPGNGANSLIIQRMNGTVGSLMPAGGPALPAETIASIEKWIDQGALDN